MIIYLVGFMGSGKSTAGKRLASALNLKFYDLDSLIEDKTGSSIRSIFKDKGEEGFRDIEKSVLLSTSNLTNSVISCGGGTPCFFDNMTFMNSIGKTVYLEMSSTQLLSRLEGAKKDRPLLVAFKGDKLKQYIIETLEVRSQFYKMATVTINGFDLDIPKLKLQILDR